MKKGNSYNGASLNGTQTYYISKFAELNWLSDGVVFVRPSLRPSAVGRIFVLSNKYEGKGKVARRPFPGSNLAMLYTKMFSAITGMR